jgi:hypothetical protein
VIEKEGAGWYSSVFFLFPLRSYSWAGCLNTFWFGPLLFDCMFLHDGFLLSLLSCQTVPCFTSFFLYYISGLENGAANNAAIHVYGEVALVVFFFSRKKQLLSCSNRVEVSCLLLGRK